MANLGKITKIPIRDEFPHEAHNFTPWLRENLSYVEEKLHIQFGDLDDIQTEVNVGPYSCDVLAPTKDGRKVVIENQFNRADHDHLGKMLTYAAGLKADVLVWIAETFRDEEITTLNWLNSMSTEESPAFFAIQVELIKIGDSLPALNLDVVVQPDTWTNKVEREIMKRRSDFKAEAYQKFWNNFINYFSKKRDELKNKKDSRWRANWLNIPAKKKGFDFTFMFWEGKIPALQLWIGKKSTKENEAIFNEIKTHEKELEKILPNLEWFNEPNQKSKKIIFSRDEPYNFTEDDEQDVFEWFVDYMPKFEEAFNPILENLR